MNMNKRRTRITVIVTMVIYLTSNALSAQDDPNQPVVKEKKVQVLVWAGSSNYAMDDFNSKLSSEGNKKINHGLNAGLELRLALSDVVVTKPPFKFNMEDFRVTIGIDYLEAGSKTTHATTVVNWELPVVGFYIMPEMTDFLKLSERPGGEGWSINLRPIGVGYYMLGEFLDAGLTVSDRPGRLAVSGTTIGILSQINLGYTSDKYKFFVSAGYRKLDFTDVSQIAEGGFTATASGGLISPGTLPETLDYSGLMIKMGLGMRF